MPNENELWNVSWGHGMLPNLPPQNPPEEYNPDITAGKVVSYLAPGGNNRLTIDAAIESIVNEARKSLYEGTPYIDIARSIQRELQDWSAEVNWSPDKFAAEFNKRISKFPDVKKAIDVGSRKLQVEQNAVQPEEQRSGGRPVSRQVNTTDNSSGIHKREWENPDELVRFPVGGNDSSSVWHYNQIGTSTNETTRNGMWSPSPEMVASVQRRF